MAISIPAIIGGVVGGMGMANMFPPLSRAISHGLNQVWKNEIVGQSEIIESYFRGHITHEVMSHELHMTGLNDERIAWLVMLRQQLLGVVQNIVLWQRNEISQDELYDRLLHLVNLKAQTKLQP
jgi:hypothetical protein